MALKIVQIYEDNPNEKETLKHYQKIIQFAVKIVLSVKK